jgi:hypothetical protein
VVIGFGRKLLESGDQRTIKNNKIVSYSLVDLLAISEAVMTTSIQEGFGYVFHEPWLAGKLVFGRNIAAVTCDFVAEGLNLDHLYDHLLIPMEWLDQQGDLMCRAYCRKVVW